MVPELLANMLDSLSNHRSKLHERFLAKERVEGLSPFPMKVMFYNSFYGKGHLWCHGLKAIFVSPAVRWSVYSVQETNIVDMNLPRGYSHNRTYER